MDFTKDFFNLVLDFGDEWVITGIEADHKKLRVYLAEAIELLKTSGVQYCFFMEDLIFTHKNGSRT